MPAQIGEWHDARPARPRRRRLLEVGACAVIAVFVVLMGVWAVVQERGGDDTGSEPLTHVHGLGVNTADGALYAATHAGLFRVEGASIERVGGQQDVMGFTVVGPDAFVASAHPDLAGRRDGEPATLGVIRSGDGGRTWERLAFAGERDLHAIAVSGPRTYVWDAMTSTLLTSTDLVAWEDLGSIELTGLAADPDDPDRLVAVDGERTMLSTDGGRSWATQQGPALVMLAWSPDGPVWGVDAGGGLHRSADGVSWCRQAALPGPPQAVAAVAGGVLWAAVEAADGTTVLASSGDDGASWSGTDGDPVPPAVDPGSPGSAEVARCR